MTVIWIDVFRRWDGTILYRRSAGGPLDRRASETALLYQGRCKLAYRFRIAASRGSAPDCTRVTKTAFVDLNGRCGGCGATALSACLHAFRGFATASPSWTRASGG